MYVIAQRIGARYGQRLADRIVAAITALRSEMDRVAIYNAVAAADMSALMQALRIDEFSRYLAGDGSIEEILRLTTLQTGAASAEALAGATGLPVTFNMRDPNAVLYARRQAAQLVTLVGAPQRETIRVIVALSHARGLTIRQSAAAVRHVVGLPAPWASAPANLGAELRAGTFTSTRRLSATDKARIRKALRTGTVTEEFIEEMQEKYAQSLIRLRALTIARTEAADAAMHGLRTSWQQAVQDGHLPPTVRRYWIVTPDDRLREEHAAVPGMNPDGVELGLPFTTPLGLSMGPPLEPNCRCGEGLLAGGRIL